MITLAHLRSLLERALTHAESPAIVRLTGRTAPHVAWAHLPRRISIPGREGGCLTADYVGHGAPPLVLDLTDPGTAHALLVALGLALGLDPGVGGLSCSWFRRNLGGYILLSDSTNWTFETAEPDPLKALALAALHVLEHP